MLRKHRLYDVIFRHDVNSLQHQTFRTGVGASPRHSTAEPWTSLAIMPIFTIDHYEDENEPLNEPLSSIQCFRVAGVGRDYFWLLASSKY